MPFNVGIGETVIFVPAVIQSGLSGATTSSGDPVIFFVQEDRTVNETTYKADGVHELGNQNGGVHVRGAQVPQYVVPIDPRTSLESTGSAWDMAATVDFVKLVSGDGNYLLNLMQKSEQDLTNTISATKTGSGNIDAYGPTFIATASGARRQWSNKTETTFNANRSSLPSGLANADFGEALKFVVNAGDSASGAHTARGDAETSATSAAASETAAKAAEDAAYALMQGSFKDALSGLAAFLSSDANRQADDGAGAPQDITQVALREIRYKMERASGKLGLTDDNGTNGDLLRFYRTTSTTTATPANKVTLFIPGMSDGNFTNTFGTDSTVQGSTSEETTIESKEVSYTGSSAVENTIHNLDTIDATRDATASANADAVVTWTLKANGNDISAVSYDVGTVIRECMDHNFASEYTVDDQSTIPGYNSGANITTMGGVLADVNARLSTFVENLAEGSVLDQLAQEVQSLQAGSDNAFLSLADSIFGNNANLYVRMKRIENALELLNSGQDDTGIQAFNIAADEAATLLAGIVDPDATKEHPGGFLDALAADGVFETTASIVEYRGALSGDAVDIYSVFRPGVPHEDISASLQLERDQDFSLANGSEATVQLASAGSFAAPSGYASVDVALTSLHVQTDPMNPDATMQEIDITNISLPQTVAQNGTTYTLNGQIEHADGIYVGTTAVVDLSWKDAADDVIMTTTFTLTVNQYSASTYSTTMKTQLYDNADMSAPTVVLPVNTDGYVEVAGTTNFYNIMFGSGGIGQNLSHKDHTLAPIHLSINHSDSSSLPPAEVERLNGGGLLPAGAEFDLDADGNLRLKFDMTQPNQTGFLGPFRTYGTNGGPAVFAYFEPVPVPVTIGDISAMQSAMGAGVEIPAGSHVSAGNHSLSVMVGDANPVPKTTHNLLASIGSKLVSDGATSSSTPNLAMIALGKVFTMLSRYTDATDGPHGVLGDDSDPVIDARTVDLSTVVHGGSERGVADIVFAPHQAMETTVAGMMLGQMKSHVVATNSFRQPVHLTLYGVDLGSIDVTFNPVIWAGDTSQQLTVQPRVDSILQRVYLDGAHVGPHRWSPLSAHLTTYPNATGDIINSGAIGYMADLFGDDSTQVGSLTIKGAPPADEYETFDNVSQTLLPIFVDSDKSQLYVQAPTGASATDVAAAIDTKLASRTTMYKMHLQMTGGNEIYVNVVPSEGPQGLPDSAVDSTMLVNTHGFLGPAWLDGTHGLHFSRGALSAPRLVMDGVSEDSVLLHAQHETLGLTEVHSVQDLSTLELDAASSHPWVITRGPSFAPETTPLLRLPRVNPEPVRMWPAGTPDKTAADVRAAMEALVAPYGINTQVVVKLEDIFQFGVVSSGTHQLNGLGGKLTFTQYIGGAYPHTDLDITYSDVPAGTEAEVVQVFLNVAHDGNDYYLKKTGEANKTIVGEIGNTTKFDGSMYLVHVQNAQMDYATTVMVQLQM